MVDEEVPAEKVLQVIIEAGGKLLDDVSCLHFPRQQLGEGKKSPGIKPDVLSPERTLTIKMCLKPEQKLFSSLKLNGASLQVSCNLNKKIHPGYSPGSFFIKAVWLLRR